MIRLTQLLKENSNKDHSHDRDMVVGVAEIIRMVDDMDNRDKIAIKMMDKFDREKVNYNVEEFIKMCGLNSVSEAAPMLNKPTIAKAPKGVKKDPIPDSAKPKDTDDKIKNETTRLGIMRKQLSLPHTADAKTKLQRRIIKTQDRIKDLKSNKG